MKTNAVLPQSEVDRLRALRELEDQSELKARVIALREAGWPLRAIGDPLEVTRVGVRSWQIGAMEDDKIVKRSQELDDVPAVPLTARGSGVRARRVYPKIPEQDGIRMRELAQQVRSIRAGTPQDSPARKAAEEYEQLLRKYVSRGVPAQHIAREAGVTRRAIVARLEKADAK